MMPAIAIVGMACRYPDARSPMELWENVLAQRRAFRRLPPERVRVEDYLSSDRDAPDCTYVAEAALIEGYDFDRERYRVAAGTFRAADLAHWLALDVASIALTDAGFPEGQGLPRETAGVLVGNTLTGEFSRANALRLRWPYVRRTLEAALAHEGWAVEQRHAFLRKLEQQYKAPFPAVSDETLAGGLSNTIAGRICNHFDLKGGGYTVDGACASSLLAVITACASLVTGDLDVALAGGVDLSLDPFELVGFAKAGALAPEEMRVYDTRSAGFWPGEGCGMVVLMREEDAARQGRRIYSVIRGWGVSSDGSGGITRPEAEGQRLAIDRAYRRTGFGIDSITYFEGHGTGTTIGDATELQVLSSVRQAANPQAPPAAIGSIKATIGHTKAAAGIAGLIKATMALHTQIVPPTTGCDVPHAELTSDGSALRALREAEAWPQDQPLRAAVSAMGFGGINTHVVLEGTATQRRTALTNSEQALVSSTQDAELFVFDAAAAEELRRQVDHLLTLAERISRAELSDLAAELQRIRVPGPIRAAIVASTPIELAHRLTTLQSWLSQSISAQLNPEKGVFLGAGTAQPRIGFLFPGQGSPAHLSGGAWRRRFDCVCDLYPHAKLPGRSDGIATEIAQPAIVTASMAALRVLTTLGVTAAVAVGHSLGELTALQWAGAMDEATLLRIATARGKAMAELGSATGAMAGIGAGQQEVKELLNGGTVVIAGLNTPLQTVVSGEASAIADVIVRAQAKGLKAVRLPVSHAFHSALVAAAVPVFATRLACEVFQPVQRPVVSTVTGTRLAPEEDLLRLLQRQVTFPVRFVEAVTEAARGVDLFLEVGPGHVLSGMVSEFLNIPVISMDSGGSSLRGLLHAVGAAHALGARVNHHALFAGRFTRPFDLNWRPRFFVNPCELAPVPQGEVPLTQSREESSRDEDLHAAPSQQHEAIVEPVELIRHLVAERAELPLSLINNDTRLLHDLHLSSITVSQIVAEAAKRLGLPPPLAPLEYATARVAEIAHALDELKRTGGASASHPTEIWPAGVDGWIRPFTVELIEQPLPAASTPIPLSLRERARVRGNSQGEWYVIASPDDPLADEIRRILKEPITGSGVVVCLPLAPDERHVDLLLEGARTVFEKKASTHFVLVQRGGGGAAFARTLHLEASDLTTCVVDVGENHPQACEWVLAEIATARGFVEAHYDESGTRREPVLRLLPELNESPELCLGPEDVLLVTGGGKGIAAECALRLAREFGVRLALLGRSQPESDSPLAANLERMAAAGVQARYLAADVTSEQAVKTAIRQVEMDLGPVTAILHGAGTNEPELISALDHEACLRTLMPKVHGLRHILAAIDPTKIRALMTFGSLIARTGLPGEAAYGLANEWVVRLTEQFQREHPICRCLAIEWSIWSGVGMGERLGRVDALMKRGITPITVDQGVSILHHLVNHAWPNVAVVVTGRFGAPPTLKMEHPNLPFLRFLERPRIYYPGIELVVDNELSTDTDPYLNDHVFKGERLFPAVMGLEAMAQVAMAVVGTDHLPIFEDVQFTRPVVVPDRAPITIRVAALVREQGRVDVVLRSNETTFQVDHFRATCRFPQTPSCLSVQGASFIPSPLAGEGEGDLPLDPDHDLYGKLLFQRGRFQRLHGYRLLRAKECVAEIKPGDGTSWFGRYLPQTLVLGDPGTRDAVIHAIQACIPHATLLPIGIDRLIFPSLSAPRPVERGEGQGEGSLQESRVTGQVTTNRFVHAVERSQEGDLFIYDAEVTGADGCVRERWEGLRLRKISELAHQGPWPAPLLGPYLERRVRELIPGSEISIAVIHSPSRLQVNPSLLAEEGWGEGDLSQAGERNDLANRRTQTDQAIQQAIGKTIAVQRRPDGKPEILVDQEFEVSAAHAGNLALAVAGLGSIACDLEPVVARTIPLWQDLLGLERFALAKLISQDTGEDTNAAATRVWTVSECLKKVGTGESAPLMLNSKYTDGWIMLTSGPWLIATVSVPVKGLENPLAIAVLFSTLSSGKNREAGAWKNFLAAAIASQPNEDK